MRYERSVLTMRTVLALCALLAFTLFVPREAGAGEPCCAVTAIDARSGVVTAKETATGRTFQFKLSDAKLLGSVKVGQAVEADFTTGKVTVRPAEASPCCGITAIDTRAGTVSVKENATSRTAQLKVTDAKLLGSLKVGQAVDVNFTTGSITVRPAGAEPVGIAGTIVK